IDLLDLMKDGSISPPKLVNSRNVSSLQGITGSTDGLHLGPLSTLSEIAAHPEVQKSYTALSDAAGHAATPQVRNMATLGGNIMQRPRCWTFGRGTSTARRRTGPVANVTRIRVRTSITPSLTTATARWGIPRPPLCRCS